MHRFVPYPAELQLEIVAPTEAAVFADAGRAFVELVEGEGGAGPRAAHEVQVEAGDRASPRLLVKAVTDHELAFERGGGGWFARVVLDV